MKKCLKNKIEVKHYFCRPVISFLLMQQPLLYHVNLFEKCICWSVFEPKGSQNRPKMRFFKFFFFYQSFLSKTLTIHRTRVERMRPSLFFSTFFTVVAITTAQLHSTKPELKFCVGSNPARGVSEIRDGEDLYNGPGWK